MARRLSVLDNIRVASPCTASWATMAGDERTRFCSLCEKSVYNLSGLTREKAERLIIEKNGKLCVRYYQRADGTILTSDCPVGLAAVRRRTIRAAAWLAAACCTVFFSLGALARGRWGSKSLSVSIYEPSSQIRQAIEDWLSPPPPPPLMGMYVVEDSRRLPEDIENAEHLRDLRDPGRDRNPRAGMMTTLQRMLNGAERTRLP